MTIVEIIKKIEEDESRMCGMTVKAKSYTIKDGRIEVWLNDANGKIVGLTDYEISTF